MSGSSQMNNDCVMMTDQSLIQNQSQQNAPESVMQLELGDDSNDEIQRYMHGRGCSKRHTVGCTDDLSSGKSSDTHSPVPSCSPTTNAGNPASSSGRTRRSGLLTVMERPPGMSNSLVSKTLIASFIVFFLWLFIL